MKLSRRSFLSRSFTLIAGGVLAGCGVKPTEIQTTLVSTAANSPQSTIPTSYRILAEGLDFPEGPAFDQRVTSGVRRLERERWLS